MKVLGRVEVELEPFEERNVFDKHLNLLCGGDHTYIRDGVAYYQDDYGDEHIWGNGMFGPVMEAAIALRQAFKVEMSGVMTARSVARSRRAKSKK